MEKFSNLFIFDENEIIKNDRNLIYVGYWKNMTDHWYGLPLIDWKGWEDIDLYNNFLIKLKSKIDNSRLIRYRGYSGCRICHKINNGSTEYIIDDKFIVPEGYIHYIEEHKIVPHKWFLEYILNN